MKKLSLLLIPCVFNILVSNIVFAHDDDHAPPAPATLDEADYGKRLQECGTWSVRVSWGALNRIRGIVANSETGKLPFKYVASVKAEKIFYGEIAPPSNAIYATDQIVKADRPQYEKEVAYGWTVADTVIQANKALPQDQQKTPWWEEDYSKWVLGNPNPEEDGDGVAVSTSATETPAAEQAPVNAQAAEMTEILKKFKAEHGEEILARAKAEREAHKTVVLGKDYGTTMGIRFYQQCRKERSLCEETDENDVCLYPSRFKNAKVPDNVQQSTGG